MNGSTRLRPALLVSVVLLLPACAQAGNPTALSTPAPRATETPALAPDLIAAEFELTLDLSTLEGDLSLPRTLASQPPQNLSYDLDLAPFQGPGVLELLGVAREPSGDLRVTLRHRHPFAAPDLTAPPTATNRADLGYTGRLLVQAQQSTAAFYGGTVSADPSLVRNSDGMVDAGQLLRTPSAGPNTHFPYLLLVDEARDNRVGPSNGGIASGTYDAAVGWQAGNFAAGWTGYDYLHEGQAADLTLVLSGEALAQGPATLGLALLIKWTDPKGNPGASDRLPPTTPDLSRFAYRLPYAALDASRIALMAAPEVPPDGTPVVFDVQLRDWDAAATESALGNLGDEPDPRKIQPGASGVPILSLDAPALIGAPITFTSQGTHTGHSGDELQYLGSLGNELNAAPGTYVGLLRAIDPEDADPLGAAYRFGIDPANLAPDATLALERRSYQVISITVGTESPAVPEILAVSPSGVAGAPGVPVQFSATTTGLPTAWDWEFNGGALPPTSTDESPLVNLTAAGDYTGILQVSNALGSSGLFPFAFSVVGSPQRGWALTWGGGFADKAGDIAVLSNGDILFGGTLTWNGAPDLPVDLDPGPTVDERLLQSTADAYLARLSPEGTYQWGQVFGGDGDEWFGFVDMDGVVALAVDELNNAVYVVGAYAGATADFDPGSGTTGLPTPFHTVWSYLARYDLSGQFQWVRSWGMMATYHTEDGADGITLDSQGNVYVSGLSEAGVDLDPGSAYLPVPGAPDKVSHFLSKFTPAGDLVWARTWDAIWSSPLGSQMDATGMTLVGRFRGSVDLDPGPGTDLHSTPGDAATFLVRLNHEGEWQWGSDFGPTTEYQTAVANAVVRDFGGGYLLTGTFRYTDIDFAPGPEVQLRNSLHQFDGFVLSLAPDRSFRWVDQWYSSGGNGDYDEGFDLTMDAQGNVVVVGTTGPNDTQATVRKYDPNGVLAWNRDWGGPDFDDASGVATIDGTSLLIIGNFHGTADFAFGGPEDLRSGYGDLFLVRLQANGTR